MVSTLRFIINIGKFLFFFEGLTTGRVVNQEVSQNKNERTQHKAKIDYTSVLVCDNPLN